MFSKIEKLPMSPIEKIEGIDNLKLIENGIKIWVVLTEKTGGNGHTSCAKYSKHIKGEICFFVW